MGVLSGELVTKSLFDLGIYHLSLWCLKGGGIASHEPQLSDGVGVRWSYLWITYGQAEDDDEKVVKAPLFSMYNKIDWSSFSKY